MPYKEQSVIQVRRNYVCYCTKEGPPVYSKGIPLDDMKNCNIELPLSQLSDLNEESEEVIPPSPIESNLVIQNEPLGNLAPKKTQRCVQIRDAILRGECRQYLMHQYPGCVPIIKQMLELHPGHFDSNHCLYIFGGTRVGKTTAVSRVLKFFEKHYDLKLLH